MPARHAAQRGRLDARPAQGGVQDEVVERDQQHHQQRVERLHLRRLEPARLRHPVGLQHPRRRLLIEERPERRHQDEQHQDAEHAARAVHRLVGVRGPRPVELPPGARAREADRRHQGQAPPLGDARAAGRRRSAASDPDRRTPGPRTPAPRARRRSASTQARPARPVRPRARPAHCGRPAGTSPGAAAPAARRRRAGGPARGSRSR